MIPPPSSSELITDVTQFPSTFSPELIIRIVSLGGALPTPSRSSLGAAPRTAPSQERALLRAASLCCKSWLPIAQRELFRYSYLYDESAIASYVAAVAGIWVDAVEVVELSGELYRSHALEALLETLQNLHELVFDGITPWCDPMIYSHSFCWTTKATHLKSLTIHYPSRTLLQSLKTSPPGTFPSLQAVSFSNAPDAVGPLLAVSPPLAAITIISRGRIDYKSLTSDLLRHRETLRRLELRSAAEERAEDEETLKEIARTGSQELEILKMGDS